MKESEAEKKAAEDQLKSLHLKKWHEIGELEYKKFLGIYGIISDCAGDGDPETAQVLLSLTIAGTRTLDDMLNQSPQRDVARDLAGHYRIWPVLHNGINASNTQRIYRLLQLGKNLPYKVSELSRFKLDPLGELVLSLIARVVDTGQLYIFFNSPDCLHETSRADELPGHALTASKLGEITADSIKDWWRCVEAEFNASYGNLSPEEIEQFATEIWGIDRTPKRALTQIGYIRDKVHQRLLSLVPKVKLPKVK